MRHEAQGLTPSIMWSASADQGHELTTREVPEPTEEFRATSSAQDVPREWPTMKLAC
jgi:hypothetical protein